MVDHRVQHTLLMLGGTVQHHRRGARAEYPLAQHLHQAGFANAGFTAQEHDLTRPVLAMRPALQEQRHFRVTAHQGREAGSARHVQATLRRTLPQDTIDLERCRQALERVGTEIVAGKVALYKPEGRWTDDDRIRRRQPLNTGGDVGGFTHRELLLAAPTAHLAHDHHPGVDADADRQLHPIVLRQTGIERSHGFHNTKTSADGSAGIVLMRLGITTVHQQPIPEILDNMAVKPLNDYGSGLLVGADDLPQIFRVELAGKGRRVHEVTEHHCELAPFGVWGLRRGGWGQGLDGLDVCGGRRWSELGSRWGRERGPVRTTRPDQDATVLIHRQALALNEFGFQIFQIRVIELELPLEGAIGQAPPTLQHGYRLVEDLLKGHRPPSLYP